MKKILNIVLALVLATSLIACGKGNTAENNATTTNNTNVATTPNDTTTSNNIVNVGVTSALSSINPLHIDVTFMSLYAQSMMFLPLVSLDKNVEPEGLLAESVTTNDNMVFTVKLRDDVNWSDGTPVTADDVVFTMLKISSPEIANTSFDFSGFVGFNEDGTSPSGATEIEGIRAIDAKTVEFESTYPMSIQSFINNICTWVGILPSHILSSYSSEELATLDWFNHPTVVDGPYFLDDYDSSHYISYHANEDYYLGKPKIEKLNFRIVQTSQLLAGLQSGEIDIIQPAIGILPNTDVKSVQALNHVTLSFTDAVTNQMTFINTNKITDARVRKAIVMAINRQQLIDVLLDGHGELSEGFLSSPSPYYDSSVETIPYDPTGAKALLDEANYDYSQTLQYYVWSGDDDMVKGIQIIQQDLTAVGINIEIHTVDLDSLMAVAGSDDVDIFSVQYTITPNDYYIDAQYLVDMEGSWTGGYQDERVHEALETTQVTTDEAEIKSAYRTLTDKMIEDVPMFSMYFISNAGVVSNRLRNAEPSLYGAFNHIENWELQD